MTGNQTGDKLLSVAVAGAVESDVSDKNWSILVKYQFLNGHR